MNIKSELHRLERNRQRSGLDYEVEARVQEALSSIERELGLLSDEDGYERHLRRYIQDTARDLDKESCGCRSSICPLKHGQLPVYLTAEKNTVKATEKYQMEHPKPHVIREARDAWNEMRKEVREVLSQCNRAVNRNDADIIELEQ